MSEVKIESKIIAERFKDARTVWNQYGSQSTKAVSDATGISTSIINALENETRSVGYEKVIALAKHYGVSVDWLSGFTNDPHPKRCAVDELGLSYKAIETIKRMKRTGLGLTGLNNLLELERPEALLL